MPFIPHTPDEIDEMLASIGESSIDALFDEIPTSLKATGNVYDVGESQTEQQVMRLMQTRAAQDDGFLCFLGAGAYEHYIPAAVWDIVSRGEFLTSYTPYQAEASQGTLQVIYEYQSMMTQLTAMEVSNASLYDGATALAEAVLMAVRANTHKTGKKILCMGVLHPYYYETVTNIVSHQSIVLSTHPTDPKTGRYSTDFSTIDWSDLVAVIIPQPNFLGMIEEVDAITRLAHQNQTFVIAVVNPMLLTLVTPPGEWGDNGADIAVGEGQPLGVPLSSGGPYFGFMTSRKSLVRNMPGRIVGKTTDANGLEGFTLTLQAREQHIRRSKATSNICTNQGLAVTAATIYMSLMGTDGLKQTALRCYQQCHVLVNALTTLGIAPVFSAPTFHEVLVALPISAQHFCERMLKEYKIIAGLAIFSHFPSLPLNLTTASTHLLLICVTDTKTSDDLNHYLDAARCILQSTNGKKSEKTASSFCQTTDGQTTEEANPC